MGHTEGPWHVAYFEDENAAVIVTAEGDGRIAEIRGNVPEEDANARLIAAAPDMLAALQDACKTLETVHLHGRADEGEAWARLVYARAAIAKAEGR